MQLIDQPDQTIPLTLVPLAPELFEQFWTIADNEEVRTYFKQLNGTKQEIFDRMPEQTNGPEDWSWLVYRGALLVGYATLKKNTMLSETLVPPVVDLDDPNLFLEEELEGEELAAYKKQKEIARKRAAFYAVDLIVHPAHRGKGFGRAIFMTVAEFARDLDIHEVYLEVEDDNEPSHLMAEGLMAKAVHESRNPFYPVTIYKYTISNLRKEVTFNGFWRELLSYVPELANHRSILRHWYFSFDGHTMIPWFAPDVKSCSLRREEGTRDIVFRLRIGVLKREDPLTLIWSLYHELGHYLQPEATPEELVNGSKEKYYREVEAWANGAVAMAGQKFYQDNLDNFQAFRLARANSYHPDNFKSGNDDLNDS